MDPFQISQFDLYRALLLTFRTGAFLMTIPVFGHVAIPRMLRVWLIVALTVLVFPSTMIAADRLPASTLHLFIIILSELTVGFLMGFAVVLLFSAVQFAGHLIGLQMGLAVANVADPLSAGQISVIGEFYYFLSLLIFILINGHHYALDALLRSFERVPLGGAVFSPELSGFLVNLTAMVFVLAIKLSAPVIITLLILNAVLGILSRTVPQMNVFIVGFPLSIGVGIAMIGVSLPVFKMLIEKMTANLQNDWATLIRLLGG
ncbi:MAG: flagellar biosynthetic protein FliR [Candidatus Latescibacterota bacterium]